RHRPLPSLPTRRSSDLASADEEIRRAAIDHLTGAYSDPTLSLAGRVRRIVAEQLPGPVPSIAEVAAELALHPRTLQRHLVVVGRSEEHTSELQSRFDLV